MLRTHNNCARRACYDRVRMHLTLVRHGDAGQNYNALGDAGRCLTPRGRTQALATGAALRERGVVLTHAWTSPLVRAVQTAELILSQLEFPGPVEAQPFLYPDSEAGPLLAALGELDAKANVLAVGHMPYMASTAGQLLGLAVSGFHTAEAFHMRFGGEPRLRGAELSWRFTGR